MADFPSPSGAYDETAFSVNNKGYVVATGSKAFWEFDPVANTWTQLGDYPGLGVHGMFSFSIADKGYVGGGQFAHDFWEFDPATGLWTQLADLPVDYIEGGVGISYKGFGYAGLGVSTMGGRKDFVWRFDPETNSWFQIASYGGAPTYLPVAFSLSNEFVFGTGSTSYNYDLTGEFYRYDCE